MPEISASQYGKLRGLSKQRVSQAIKNAKLDKCMKRNADGTLWRDPTSGGFLLTPEIADVEWEKNVGLHPNAALARVQVDDSPAADPAAPTPRSGKSSVKRYAEAPTVTKKPATQSGGEYMNSRASRETYMAEMARLDYEQRIGELVPAIEVTAMLEKLVTETKTRILAVPGKAKSQIPHLKTDDVLLIDQLLRETLTELADARFIQ